jgi:hypothetical protein
VRILADLPRPMRVSRKGRLAGGGADDWAAPLLLIEAGVPPPRGADTVARIAALAGGEARAKSECPELRRREVDQPVGSPTALSRRGTHAGVPKRGIPFDRTTPSSPTAAHDGGSAARRSSVKIAKWVVLLVIAAVAGLMMLGSMDDATSPPTSRESESSRGTRPLSVQARSVTLDYRAGTMRIEGTASGLTGIAADTLWVWAYFVNTAEGGKASRSDEPIPVLRSDRADTASFVATGPFHWATNAGVPRDGYFARVRVSADRAGSTVGTALRDYDISTMVRVTVGGN